MSTENFEKALKEIDRFNSQDPRQKIVDGITHPQELAYSKSLTEWVLKLDPQASEALRIAARGQHISRWTVPRAEYPADRSGYLRWREDLKAFHAEKVGGILRDVGYEEDFIQRVKFLILKNNIKEDTDAQTLEDALCLVFFETQFMNLMEKTPVDKMKTLVRKTWKKMSAKGRNIALQMNLPFEEKHFLESTLRIPTIAGSHFRLIAGTIPSEGGQSAPGGGLMGSRACWGPSILSLSSSIRAHSFVRAGGR